MYTSLNSPEKLTNWRNDGGDPCGEAWKGVSCEGSAVVSMYVYDYDSLNKNDDFCLMRDCVYWFFVC